MQTITHHTKNSVDNFVPYSDACLFICGVPIGLVFFNISHTLPTGYDIPSHYDVYTDSFERMIMAMRGYILTSSESFVLQVCETIVVDNDDPLTYHILKTTSPPVEDVPIVSVPDVQENDFYSDIVDEFVKETFPGNVVSVASSQTVNSLLSMDFRRHIGSIYDLNEFSDFVSWNDFYSEKRNFFFFLWAQLLSLNDRNGMDLCLSYQDLLVRFPVGEILYSDVDYESLCNAQGVKVGWKLPPPVH